MLEGLKSILFGEDARKIPLAESLERSAMQQELQELREKMEQPRVMAMGILVDSFVVSFNGEKNLGEMGPAKRLLPDYPTLRTRSWQLHLENDTSQMTTNRKTVWTIGMGLRLQAEPQKEVLESEGIDIDTEQFNKAVEARFKVYTSSRMADYANMVPLNVKASEAYKNYEVAGDMLVILRYINKVVKVQHIDADCVRTPMGIEGITFNGAYYAGNGNRIEDGIEFDKTTGEHVAYHVTVHSDRAEYPMGKYERIPARNAKTGLVTAYLVYGQRYRINSKRGIPRQAAVMQTLKQMDQYKEATLGTAMERQRLAYFVRHDVNSSGEDNFTTRALTAAGFDRQGNLPTDVNGKQLARDIQVSTNRQTVNLTPGADIVMPESKNELYFNEFNGANADMVYGVANIPPNVASSKYNDSFSASRAALKDWEHTLHVDRYYFAEQYYQPIYNFWLHVEVMTGKIKAPGYIDAYFSQNVVALEAYRMARWVGATVPHIDPVKEVEAERMKLGDTGAGIPLTTVEAATEALNSGDSANNLAQYGRELKDFKQTIPQPTPPAPGDTGKQPGGA